MSSLMRWDPTRGMLSLRDAMDRLMADSFVPSMGALGNLPESLAVDMYQTDDAIIVKMALPGVKPEDVDINVTGNTLTIRGETRDEDEVHEGNYYRREQRYGSFSRSMELPVMVNSAKAEAEIENGILRLSLPKAEEAKPKQITVKAKKK